MTQDRKDQLFEGMIEWICETVKDSKDLYILLHNHLGMTQEELHDCCIESLDEFFPSDARTRLKQKVLANYDDFKAKWLHMQPIELIAICDEMESVTRMMKELPFAVSEDDAEYLLRFKNPLEVVSSEWLSQNGMDANIDQEMSHVLWQLTDRREAEEYFELEDEDCGEDLSPQL